MLIEHTIPPIYDKNSEVLILGSFPSPKSREKMIYYGNKQNRFWLVLSKVFDEPYPQTAENKKQFLLNHNIALWDVIAQCEISGASDSSIKNAKANDIDIILKTANIKAIFTTGKTATELYKKFFNKESIYLPSPSPANCAYTLEALINEYSKLLVYLRK